MQQENLTVLLIRAHLLSPHLITSQSHYIWNSDNLDPFDEVDLDEQLPCLTTTTVVAVHDVQDVQEAGCN